MRYLVASKFYKLQILICLLVINCAPQNNQEKIVSNSQLMENSKELAVGDSIKVYGGYFDEPRYLQNPKVKYKKGIVLKFIDSERGDKSAIIELDEAIVGDTITTKFIMISMRYENQNWATDGPVHIVLYNQVPDFQNSAQEQRSEWIEAAASYMIL